jgi:asparagine synthase (glutamine-hydrolysing)
MCGIAGIIDFENRPVESSFLLAMSRSLTHRGPDDEGYVLIDELGSRYTSYSGPSSPSELQAQLPLLRAENGLPTANIGLCHRRFSIIDLSAAGHQPFFDRERSCCVVFNGEIYNYLEVRDELAAKGVVFSTSSDTEVLLQAYRQWGTDCFERMNGFWSVALYDFKKKQLLLSRDRLGKKPLYWTKVGSRVYFASELKALLRIPEIYSRRQVNEEAIHSWLLYGQKDLNFTTFFAGIHSLPSGCWSIADATFPEHSKQYWSVPKERLSEQDISAEDAAATLRNILQDSVTIRLRADVPLSVELSGGLDSSTLVALAAQVHRGKITTYTVRFPEPEYNEEPFARSVAEHYGVDYQVLESPTENFWGQILAFTYLEEEPYHSPNLQTNQVIWARMRARGTKVSLNGAGGDENFAGYSAYYVPTQIENLVDGRWSTYLENATKYSQGNTNIRSLCSPIFRLATAASMRFLPRSWRGNGTTVDYFTGKYFPHTSSAAQTLSQALYNDMTNTLMPYWLRSGDRGYMGIPLEVRAPFLDYRVIDFAFRLPVRYLFRHGWHKWILRKSVEDILPADVVWRRNKLGFPFPFGRFYSENRALVDLTLKKANNPYIDFSKSHRFRHDWKTLSFILWYELFINENVQLFHELEDLAGQAGLREHTGFAPEFLSAEFSRP